MIKFQFTPPRGGRLSSISVGLALGIFQFTPPRGGRPKTWLPVEKPKNFNSRPRVGGDAARNHFDRSPDAISIHAPAWGATHGCEAIHTHIAISIHAPAWGATWMQSPAAESSAISIHAPAWGATLREWRAEQPRGISIHAPAWGATVEIIRYGNPDNISIHAPAWGATRPCLYRDRRDHHFNSRPRVGGDPVHPQRPRWP